MDKKLYIVNSAISTKKDGLPITLSRDSIDEIKSQNYFIHFVDSLLIYNGSFLVFYFLKNKSFQLDVYNIYLFILFNFSVIAGSILSKKFKYIKQNKYEHTIGKLFLSLLISVCSLIILFSLFELQYTMKIYILGAIFSGLVIESVYFISLGTKEKSKISFFTHIKSSLKYLFLDFLILLFFCAVEIVANLNPNENIEMEFILIAVIFIAWLFSAATTHKFLPLVIPSNRRDAFELQIKFYLRFIILVFLLLVFLQIEYYNSVHFISAILGYSVVSSLLSMVVFAPKIENDANKPTIRFLKSHSLNNPIVWSREKISKLKYGFAGNEADNATVQQKIQIENLKKYGEVFSILNNILDLNTFDASKTLVIGSDEKNDIPILEPDSYQLFVNLHILNDQINLNNYLHYVRNLLVERGVFAGCFLPHLYRYNRFLKRYSFWPGNILFFFDLIWKRIFPKLPITRLVYSTFGKSKDQAISLAEGLGRLVYTGYKILDLSVVNDIVFFAAVKDENPTYEDKAFYSPVFKMKRVGKDGRFIYVYKLRTMYAYSEFIQDLVYDSNGSFNGDKITDDFRLPFWGKFLRKYWLDELPMIINLLKGDIKLVGVRPLSVTKFNLYPKYLQELRTATKPGLIPPFYRDLPKTFNGLIESERRYLISYSKNPFKTDVEYFFKAFFNIIFKKARSS